MVSGPRPTSVTRCSAAREAKVSSQGSGSWEEAACSGWRCGGCRQVWSAEPGLAAVSGAGT